MFLLVFNNAILLARQLSGLLTICAALIDDDLIISLSNSVRAKFIQMKGSSEIFRICYLCVGLTSTSFIASPTLMHLHIVQVTKKIEEQNRENFIFYVFAQENRVKN